ncbi:MAG: hypothetical protein J0M34_09290 [Alphaproteobacteria bacterium]|nr:hypothetical protein [Alphaproteobacteria bacterium]
MATMRFAGNTFEVKKAPVDKDGFVDVQYTISGSNTAVLHAFCQEQQCSPSPMVNGAFTLRSSDVNSASPNGDSPAVKAIYDALKAATIERGGPAG